MLLTASARVVGQAAPGLNTASCISTMLLSGVNSGVVHACNCCMISHNCFLQAKYEQYFHSMLCGSVVCWHCIAMTDKACLVYYAMIGRV